MFQLPLMLGALRSFAPLLLGLALAAAWALHANHLGNRVAAAQAETGQYRLALERERAARAAERAAAERAAHEAIAAYRAREQELSAEFARLQGETRVQVQRASRDAAHARAVLDRLRHAARAAADRGDAAAGAAAAAGGAPTAGAGLVLADVLGRCGERLVQLGEHADHSRAAGLACERAYDALRSVFQPGAP